MAAAGFVEARDEMAKLGVRQPAGDGAFEDAALLAMPHLVGRLALAGDHQNQLARRRPVPPPGTAAGAGGRGSASVRGGRGGHRRRATPRESRVRVRRSMRRRRRRRHRLDGRLGQLRELARRRPLPCRAWAPPDRPARGAAAGGGRRRRKGSAERATLSQSCRSSSERPRRLRLMPASRGRSTMKRPAARMAPARSPGRLARPEEDVAARRPDDRRAGVLGDQQPLERRSVGEQRLDPDRHVKAVAGAGRPQGCATGSAAPSPPRSARGPGHRPVPRGRR